MYKQQINENMLEIAMKMVKIQSVNTTLGEKNIGDFLEEYFKSIPYFKEHPEYLIVKQLNDDSLGRKNVMALLRGEKKGTVNEMSRTLLWHGHTDTVGVEDYGALAELACKPDELMAALKTMELQADVKADLDSGDYIFGRGCCDMKSGDAVFIGLIEELSRHPEKLLGNILISLNPVEENLHTGIIEGIDTLLELKERYGLKYEMAINNDYICPLFPGDNVKTIYTGVVGKLLPCFYIQGHETHVGQCFEGFDASMAAARLVDNINMNTDLCDGYEGEYTLPPSVLKLKDLKGWYNVQTAHEALVYFNYFVHNASIESIIEKLKTKAQNSMDEVYAGNKLKALKFADISGQNMTVPDFKPEVMTYDELKKSLLKDGLITEQAIYKLEMEITSAEMEKGTDAREIPVEIIRRLLAVGRKKNPLIVLYFAAPYCPHNTLQDKSADLIETLEKVKAKMEKTTGEKYRMMKFFPSLSDSSYLKIDDDAESVEMLRQNFPAQGSLYPISIEKIQKLDIPAVNYGCYGKDAHKWTERVNVPYTFGILPELIKTTLAEMNYI